MKQTSFSVSSDIRDAHTLPAAFYRQEAWFERCREEIFTRSWHCIGLRDELPDSGSVQPFELLPGFLSEPLLLTRDQDGVRRCLSNVCTHRANLLMSEPGPCREIRCRYHGRRFGLDGNMISMPEFKEAKNFPSDNDHLPALPLAEFGPLLFTNLDKQADFSRWLAPIRQRIDWLKPEEFVHAPQYSALYEIDAHWALYVDNYLEGFHIPFVHPGLNQLLDYGDYRYEMLDQGVLQIGMAKEGEQHFEVPEGHPEAGEKVAAWYFWMFPNLMLNFYPWGLSLNIVEPISPGRSNIRYETFLREGVAYDDSNWNFTATVEFEDQAVVESVQRGVSSRLYDSGRFSPNREPGVHHFHRMLAKQLKS